MGIKDRITAIHSSGVASSAVIEFQSEAYANSAYADQTAPYQWPVPGDPANTTLPLKLVHDASPEVRAYGTALSVAWRAASQILTPVFQNRGVSLNLSTNRIRGELNVKVGARIFTILKIKSLVNGKFCMDPDGISRNVPEWIPNDLSVRVASAIKDDDCFDIP